LSASGPGGDSYRGIARVGLQVADALAYAHRQGILHRDIKPSNLLLDQQGTVWVTDFGLAKAEGADDLTQTGDIVGTIRFMAPERFDGRSLPQGDVYSLGVTLYELLALHPAFDDTNKARLVEKVLHEAPVALRKIDPRVPRDLETIVLKCLNKDPAGRYATADLLAEDLRRFLADRPIRARRASSAERLGRWARRNPAVAGLLGAVAALLVAVSVVSTFAAVRLNADREQIRQAERAARLREAEALVGEAHGIRYSRRPGQRFEALAALERAAVIGRELGQPPEWFGRLRNEAIAALALPDIHITQSWDGFPPGTHWADVSPDFELYARTDKQGDCSVRRVADDTEVARLPGLGVPATVRFGPGRRLSVVSLRGDVGRCQLWDLSGTEPVRLLNSPREVFGGDETFSRDGRLFVLHYRDGSVEVFATDTGEPRYRLAANGITTESLSDLHPTEPLLAVCSYYSPLLQVRDLRTGAAVVSLRLPWHGSGSCAWRPDGRALAVSDGNSGRIHLYAFDPANPALRLTRTAQGSNSCAWLLFNPNGDRLVARGWSAIVDLFDAHTGRLLFSTHALPLIGKQPRFDPTGERLAAARVGDRQERIGVWSVADGREYRALAHAGSDRAADVRKPAIHPGGRLAAQSYPEGLALFDLETGHEVGFVKVPRGVGEISFDGAGNLLSNGFAGFFRWPVQADPAGPGRLTLGPPERLPFPPGDIGVAASRDGRVIAQAMHTGFGMGAYAGGWILYPDSPRPRWVEVGTGMRTCDVSPDGRWVAFGHHAHRVNVYEAETGRRVWQSPEDGGDSCRFSPDGRWLLTQNDGGRAYTVGTWEPGPRLGPGTPWDASADGLAVLGLPDGVYRLVELATGRELARLEDPQQGHGRASLTPDGTRLVVAAEDGLRVWELRRIREQLAKLGLDWDAPPYPKADDAGNGPPLEVTIDSGAIEADLLAGVGDELRHNGDLAGALAALQQAQALTPDDAELNNCVAWLLAICPDPKLRDAPRAVELARKTVDAAPNGAWYWRTLGMAHHFAGDDNAAVKALTRSLQLRRGGEAFDYFLLAAAHQKLGNKEKARQWYDRGVAWMAANKTPYAAELAVLRADAEALLGIEKQAEPAPDKTSSDKKE
jgi:WD40 repeat protein